MSVVMLCCVYIGRLTCRHVIEDIEDIWVVKDIKDPRLRRIEVWKDILGDYGGDELLHRLVLIMKKGNQKSTDDTIEDEKGEMLVVRCIEKIYQIILDEVDEGKHDFVPIRLSRLTPMQAAVMMEVCREAEVNYGLLDVYGKCIEAPKEPLDLVRKKRKGKKEKKEEEDEDE